MKRTSLYLDESLVGLVKEMADKQKRSVSYMVSALLEAAIREKNRKKKNVHSDSENSK